MSQGKEWNKDEVIEILKPFFKLGCDVAKACNYAGIPRTTVQTWIEKDESLRLKVNVWRNELGFKARNIWAERLEKGDFNAAHEWLRKKEKDEFSDRTEITGAGGKDLFKPSKEEQEEVDKALEDV